MSLPAETFAPKNPATGPWLRKLRHSRMLIWSALETLDRALAVDIATRTDLHVEIEDLRTKLETVLSVIADVIEGRE